jgi:hydrogenase maturation factor HypE
MASVSEIRNRVIDSLLAINDSDYLNALDKMIRSANVQDEKVSLTEEQKIMLSMSDDDIQNSRIIDQQTLNERELEWLRK